MTRYAREPGVELALSWVVVGAGRGHVGAPKVVGHGRTYTIARAARGRHIACMADANAGGYIPIGIANTSIRR